MHLKEEARDFLEPETIKDLVKKYSQFINFNIYLWTSKTEEVEEPIEEEAEAEKKDDAEKKDETEEKKNEEKKEDDDVEVEEAEEDKEKKPKTKKVSGRLKWNELCDNDQITYRFDSLVLFWKEQRFIQRHDSLIHILFRSRRQSGTGNL